MSFPPHDMGLSQVLEHPKRVPNPKETHVAGAPGFEGFLGPDAYGFVSKQAGGCLCTLKPR